MRYRKHMSGDGREHDFAHREAFAVLCDMAHDHFGAVPAGKLLEAQQP